jgi:hypothetical protein
MSDNSKPDPPIFKHLSPKTQSYLRVGQQKREEKAAAEAKEAEMASSEQT